jgi:hypothetical protein
MNKMKSRQHNDSSNVAYLGHYYFLSIYSQLYQLDRLSVKIALACMVGISSLTGQLNDINLLSSQSAFVAVEKLATAAVPLLYINEVLADPKSAMS